MTERTQSIPTYESLRKATAPQLHLVDTQTGEVVEDDRDVLIAQLESEKRGQSLQIGKLKKEIRELRLVEPETQAIMEVLEYWRGRCKPTASLAVAGKRWEKVRARLREKFTDRPPFTPAELKLAVDGALLDPWLSGRDRKSKGYLDAETIFRDSEMVERLRDLALGFKAQTGVRFGDLIEVADELRFVDWKLLLRVCVCGHRRVGHSRGDPDHAGCERCFFCGCEDFDLDWTDSFNIRQEG